MSEFENMNFDAQSRIIGEDSSTRNAKVKVFGVGGAGGNTVNRMKQMNIEGVEYYAVNTDAMALDLSLADHKIVIGEKTTKGLGAGMDPEKASKAVEENIEELKEAMKGADMVFVTAGMGGGTGTGAAPIVANVAREMGILTVAVVTKPFRFEGNARSSIALAGIKALRECVDTIIVVENKKLLTLLQSSNQKATMEEAFKMADEILGNAVQSICGIMFHHGLVHVDFADIRKVMLKGGSALMGTGCAQGEKRGIAAADLALASPLLEDINIEGASGVLINVAHGENYSLLEHSDAMEHIYEKVGEEGDPNIIIGDITVPELGDKVCITIIATGCGGTSNAQPAAAPAFNMNQTMQMTGFANPALSAQQTVAVPVQKQAATPAVQQATPRPTAVNFFAEAMATAAPAAAPVAAAPAAPAAAPAAAPEMFSRHMAPVAQPRPVEVAPAMAAAPAVAAAYASPAFDATATAVVEEDVMPRVPETSEISAVADDDVMNGGRAGMKTPAFTRNYGAVERQQAVEESIKDSTQDYSIPAYLRGGFSDNF